MPGGPGGPCKKGSKTSLLNSLIVAESLRSFPVQSGPYSKWAKALSFISLTSTKKMQDAKLNSKGTMLMSRTGSPA